MFSIFLPATVTYCLFKKSNIYGISGST